MCMCTCTWRIWVHYPVCGMLCKCTCTRHVQRHVRLHIQVHTFFTYWENVQSLTKINAVETITGFMHGAEVMFLC
jgi:hypothetical protein